MQEQGGARAKVQDVQLLDAVQAGPQAGVGRFVFQCLWRITGTVNHWGHSHQRRNQYGARIAIRPVDETWKITALDVTEERAAAMTGGRICLIAIEGLTFPVSGGRLLP